MPPLNPRKPLEKLRKTAENTQNTKEFPWSEKTKENQNTKEKKIRAQVTRQEPTKFLLPFSQQKSVFGAVEAVVLENGVFVPYTENFIEGEGAPEQGP